MPFAGHRKFFLTPQFATLEPNFDFLNPQVRNCTFKSFSLLAQVRNDFSGSLNMQPQVCNHVILEVHDRKSAKVRNESKKKKSKKSTQQTSRKKITVQKLCKGCITECAYTFYFFLTRRQRS